jgi:hypothetical protein
MSKRYALPEFLAHTNIDEKTYVRWLRRKAQAHIKRDRNRGNLSAVGESYRRAIHDAVIQCEGRDYYTGETLDWSLISQYDNEASASGRRQYKAKFALLPTVDHVGDGTGAADFVICGWRTNDMKNDMSHTELAAACIRILHHLGFAIQAPRNPLDDQADDTIDLAISSWQKATQ